MPIPLPKALFATFDVIPGPTRHAAVSQTALRALSQHFQVDAITVKSPELGHMEKTDRLRLLRLPAGKGDHLAQLEAFRRAILRQIEGEEYHVVHIRSLFLGSVLAKRKAELGIKVVIEASRFDSLELPILHPQLAANKQAADKILADETIAIQEADALITPCKVTKDYIEERGRRENVFFIPDGVNIDLFDWQAVRQQKYPIILYVGSLTPWQGLVTLIESMEILSRSSDVRLVIIHPGNDEQWQTPLKNLAQNLGIRKKVEFRTATQEALPEILCQSDICVAPYARVNRNFKQGHFPLKIIEYLACRRPVVASKLPFVEEVITDGIEGLLFSPGNAEELAQKLGQILSDKALANRISDAGYRRTRDIFNSARTRRRYSDVYRSVWELAKEEFPKSGLEIPAETEIDTLELDSSPSSDKQEIQTNPKSTLLSKEDDTPQHTEEKTTIYAMPPNPFSSDSSQKFSALVIPKSNPELPPVLVSLEEIAKKDVKPEVSNKPEDLPTPRRPTLRSEPIPQAKELPRPPIRTELPRLKTSENPIKTPANKLETQTPLPKESPPKTSNDTSKKG